MSRHHGTEVLQTHVFVRRWIVYVRYAVHTLSSEQYDDDDIGHRRTLLPLWGNSPVVQEPLQGDARSLSGGNRDCDGVSRMRPVQVPSGAGSGETEATLADNGDTPRVSAGNCQVHVQKCRQAVQNQFSHKHKEKRRVSRLASVQR